MYSFQLGLIGFSLPIRPGRHPYSHKDEDLTRFLSRESAKAPSACSKSPLSLSGIPAFVALKEGLTS
jgi:hypothetical protein